MLIYPAFYCRFYSLKDRNPCLLLIEYLKPAQRIHEWQPENCRYYRQNPGPAALFFLFLVFLLLAPLRQMPAPFRPQRRRPFGIAVVEEFRRADAVGAEGAEVLAQLPPGATKSGV